MNARFVGIVLAVFAVGHSTCLSANATMLLTAHTPTITVKHATVLRP
jgi:hypothetical protein